VTALGFVLCTHVLAAIFGAGQVGVLAAVIVPALRADAPARACLLPVLRGFLLWMNLSLAILVLTGGILDYQMGRTLHTMWWFRISFLLTVVLGALSGRMRGMLRRAVGPSGQVADAAMAGLATPAWTMFGLTAAIVVLMVLRSW
jgi:uncharacterized membrane protein